MRPQLDLMLLYDAAERVQRVTREERAVKRRLAQMGFIACLAEHPLPADWESAECSDADQIDE